MAVTEGPRAGWGITEWLLAATVNALRVANWQRAGDKNRPQPPMVEPPTATGTHHRARSTLTVAQKRARLLDLQQRAGKGDTNGR